MGDILDEDLALRAAEGADAIVHLAANTGVMPSIENPRADCMSNVIGTLNYLEAARLNGVGRFVFASSGGTTIGDAEPPIHEEMVPHPVSPYGASKLSGEGYCSAYSGTFGVDTVALRFGNVYGPLSGHKNSVVARFIKRATEGEVLEIYGDGTQTRDFIYVGDLIRAVRLAATVEGVGGEVFQIATSAETTVRELTDRLLPVLASAGIGDVEVRNAEARRGEVRRNYADTSKASGCSAGRPRSASTRACVAPWRGLRDRGRVLGIRDGARAPNPASPGAEVERRLRDGRHERAECEGEGYSGEDLRLHGHQARG